jgi:HSP20 family protein
MAALVEPVPDWVRELNRFFGNQRQIAQFVPPADVLVDDEGVTVYMDVPGIRAEDLEIEVENDVLTVRGTRPYPYQGQEGNIRRVERGFGRFERSLRVMPGLDPNAVEAAVHEGVLSLRIPKPEQLKPHRIQVKAGEESEGRQLEGSPS